ncbi:hypothetical protein ACFWWM_25940 [Streptomyces sp. NPDC058682]|uniref:hypothetical protein n=1 Tax=unclassified Streptomyces TaxID=2593676 RepID=UPI0022560895|nr:hypothetical protein [Streptomyces sp. NBC_01214]MCX4808751.1 hypothetical protein [Streptomyces sp. NBC_01214]
MRYTGTGAAATLDYGLSQRALTTVSGRSGDVAELITHRLLTLTRSSLQALDEPTVRAVVRQAVAGAWEAPVTPGAPVMTTSAL